MLRIARVLKSGDEPIAQPCELVPTVPRVVDAAPLNGYLWQLIHMMANQYLPK
jgi:hypothetical protein